MDDDEYSLDLGWHALNYRTALMPEEAQRAWEELEACVERLIQQAIRDHYRAEARKLEKQ